MVNQITIILMIVHPLIANQQCIKHLIIFRENFSSNDRSSEDKCK